jgi:hypothetical protein
MVRHAERREQFGFVGDRAIIAIFETVEIEADGFAAVAQGVHPVALDSGRRADAGVGPVLVGVPAVFGDHQLPVEPAILFVQAEQDATITFISGSRGFSLLVPIRTRPPAMTGVEWASEPSSTDHRMLRPWQGQRAGNGPSVETMLREWR